MQINVGGKTWIVDEQALLNWLFSNAVQPEQKTQVVKEVTKENDGRTLLHG